MQLTEVAEGSGVVTVTGGGRRLDLLAGPLFVDELDLLRARLIEIGRRSAADGYDRLRPLLDRMTPTDRAVAVEKIASEADDEPAQIRRGAETTEGVALELWLRTRRQHPDVTFQAVAAAVTDDNRDAVALRLRDISASYPAKKG